VTEATVTTSCFATLNVGDKVSMDMPDRRWWKRLWCRLVGRPSPTLRQFYVVTAVAASVTSLRPIDRSSDR
jgi:hypothetical protein